MEAIKEKIKNLDEIDKSLREGAKLHGFRSGGGLRVIRVEKDGDNLGYGEHPHVLEALQHTNEDLLAGGRKYSEVYGSNGIYPHYLTGSATATNDLDQWLLAGHVIDAKLVDGEIQVSLEGTRTFKTPESILEKVRQTQTPIEWEGRGFRFRSVPGDWFNGKQGVTTEVIEEAEGDKSSWHYDVIKKGSAKKFILAVNAALNAEEIEKL